MLDTRKGMFGEAVNIVYLGTNSRNAEKFISSVKTGHDNIILVSPISTWNLYKVLLHSNSGITVLDTFDDRESKVELVQLMTGLGKRASSKALKILNYNFSLVERNLDILRWCAQTKTDVETPLMDNESMNYNDILFYLAGSQNATRDKFRRVLSKYRYGFNSMQKYFIKSIDQYIDSYLYGTETPSYTSKQLSRFLFLEDALILKVFFEKARKVEDILKGEVLK